MVGGWPPLRGMIALARRGGRSCRGGRVAPLSRVGIRVAYTHYKLASRTTSLFFILWNISGIAGIFYIRVRLSRREEWEKGVPARRDAAGDTKRTSEIYNPENLPGLN